MPIVKKKTAALVLVLAASAVLFSCAWWGLEGGAVRERVVRNGFPDREGESCFMALEMEYEAWTRRAERFIRLYNRVIAPQSFGYGSPAYPPLIRDNVIYMYADCSSRAGSIGRYRYYPADRAVYDRLLGQASY